MRIVEDVRCFTESLPDLVLTIGSFDGLHLGHQRIVGALVETARKRGGTAALMTLSPHPRQVFAEDSVPNLLTCDAMKNRILAELGVDVLFVLPFSREVAGIPPQTFLEEIILGRCAARHLLVGHDFAFGKGARGDFAFLAERAETLGYTVEEVPPLIVQGERVSSTLVRECILEGDLARAEFFLGRKYAMMGEVIRGRGIGRKLGFPTANLRPGVHVVPAHGVYAAEAVVAGQRRVAAVNIGIAPTIRHEDIMVEAYLLDFEGDIAGETVELIFHYRLRPEEKFESYEALTGAIDRDVREIQAYFAGTRD